MGMIFGYASYVHRFLAGTPHGVTWARTLAGLFILAIFGAYAWTTFRMKARMSRRMTLMDPSVTN